MSYLGAFFFLYGQERGYEEVFFIPEQCHFELAEQVSHVTADVVRLKSRVPKEELQVADPHHPYKLLSNKYLVFSVKYPKLNTALTLFKTFPKLIYSKKQH